MMAQKVELRQSFWWYCEDCGKENFGRAMSHEASEEELESMKEAMGVPPEANADFMYFPVSVKCEHCGNTFGTVVDGDDGSDEEYNDMNPFEGD